MKLGIIGSEGAKFTDVTEAAARLLIDKLVSPDEVREVISGACHLGGIDVWAIEVAKALGCSTREFPPKSLSWPHYRARNIQIAEASDVIHVITLAELPPGWTGMRFDGCYHCKTRDHVKSGACWTARYAERTFGHAGCWHVIAADGSVKSSW